MKISIDKNLVKELLVIEDFFNKVPEYFYLKEAGSKINEALGQQGGCSACTESNLINPTIMNFLSHTVNMYLDCGVDSLNKFKQFVKEYKDGGDDFQIGVFYKESDESEVVELII